MPEEPYRLSRFLDAQGPVYEQVQLELRRGRKASHWMWFIFPQIVGLGASPMAKEYAITSLDEARAYLKHPVLGQRLGECVDLVNGIEGRYVEEIFGHPDHLKFQSSMTLFSQAAPDDRRFTDALQRYFDGAPDPFTLQRLGG